MTGYDVNVEQFLRLADGLLGPQGVSPLRSPRRLLAILTLALAACSSAPLPQSPLARSGRVDDPWLEGATCAKQSVDTTGLRVEALTPGSGQVVGAGDTVRVHYVARTLGGTVLHDTDPSTPPIELILGSTPIVCGFERALLGQRAGAHLRVTVPARLAFGDAGRPPSVPPSTDLVLTVDLWSANVPGLVQRAPSKRGTLIPADFHGPLEGVGDAIERGLPGGSCAPH